MVNLNPTGEQKRYIKNLRIATLVVIQAQVSKGYDLITLSDLYDILNATSLAERTSVQWGVRDAKDANVICKIKGQRSVYSVVK